MAIEEPKSVIKMELSELKEVIIKALRLCQRKLNEQPTIILSESDFERLVSWGIMKKLGQVNYKRHLSAAYTVHTQITHHKNGKIKHNRRPDILLLTEDGLNNANNSKGFIYTGNSFALELKYIKVNDTDYLRKVKKDLDKRSELYRNSWLYVVVLIETDNEKIFKNKKEEIQKLAKRKRAFGVNLFCQVMKKQKVDYVVVE